jgi:hypothetical protein
VVLSLTASVLTVMPLNGAALVAEGPIASATFSVPGKRAWVPATAQVDNSFAFEHWHSDVTLSELFLGCKVRKADVSCRRPGSRPSASTSSARTSPPPARRTSRRRPRRRLPAHSPR